MVGRRSYSGLAGALFAVALIAPATFASAQAVPSPTPSSRADENAAIVKPLSEIGRVRSRTPYCSALARARAGIDAAIAFEYSTPILANDLRTFNLDSGLGREKSRTKTERDLSALWDLALAGRDDVRALRDAAKAPGVDEEKRKAMLDFANALDGAKGRQMLLTKSMARIYGALAEAPIRNITNTPQDDHGAAAIAPRIPAGERSSSVDAAPSLRNPSLASYTTAQAEALEDSQRLQQLFNTFTAESFIRDDLKRAAQQGNKAVQLGGCNGV
jgi:hypothetical protein